MFWFKISYISPLHLNIPKSEALVQHSFTLLFIFKEPAFRSWEFIFINNPVNLTSSKNIERNYLIPASKFVPKKKKMINKSQSGKSFDGEDTTMRVGLVKQNRAIALCLLFTQVLFPCLTSLIFFLFHYDFTMVKLSFTFQNISKSFLGMLLQRTNRQKIPGFRRDVEFSYSTKGAEFYCKVASQREC